MDIKIKSCCIDQMFQGISMRGVVWFLVWAQFVLLHLYQVAESFQPFVVPPPTVDTLNTTAYLGRWYQMYASLIPNATFEHNASCVSADYYLSEKENAVFALTNAQR